MGLLLNHELSPSSNPIVDALAPAPEAQDKPQVAAKPEAAHDHDHEVSTGIKLVNLTAVVMPLVGVVAAAISVWGWGFGWLYLFLLLGMYVITGLGITIGYHRLFTHRAFEAGPVVTSFFGIAGSMALEGPIFKWVADHRRHHANSDMENDPHSPHLHGAGWKGFWQGLYHAHMGWVYRQDIPNWQKWIGDLKRNRLVGKLSRLFLVWALVGLAIPTVIAGLWTMSWQGAALGFLWGGLVRIALVHHITWSINSVCHIWGSRMFKSGDHSKNNLIFGILAFGEGWHNNHHAFPTSARHGLAWWQFDSSYLLIKLMEKLGLVRNVRVPSAAAMQTKRLTPDQH
jgi:stearoyl-CoA desaturase (delta-9 desaturase)